MYLNYLIKSLLNDLKRSWAYSISTKIYLNSTGKKYQEKLALYNEGYAYKT